MLLLRLLLLRLLLLLLRVPCVSHRNLRESCLIRLFFSGGGGSGSSEKRATISDMIALASLITRRTKRMSTHPEGKVVKRNSRREKRTAVGAWARASSVLRQEDKGEPPVATTWLEGGRLMQNGTRTIDHRRVLVKVLGEKILEQMLAASHTASAKELTANTTGAANPKV